jgi:methionine biosynthesis protein MetW
MTNDRLLSTVKVGKKVIDLGCGSGYFLDLLQQYCDVAIGIDISNRRILLRTFTKHFWTYISADLNRHLPIKNEYFDTIFANQVIEHLHDPIFFAEEIFRILKPGGSAIITTPNIRYIKHILRLVVKGLGPKTANNNTFDGRWDNGHIHYFTHRDLFRIFCRAGFKNITSMAFIKISDKNSILRTYFSRFSKNFFIKEFLSGNILIVVKK